MITEKYVVDVFSSRQLSQNIVEEIKLSEFELLHLDKFLKVDINNIDSEVFEEYYEVLLWLNPQSFVFYLGILIKVTIREKSPEGVAVDLILQIIGAGVTNFAQSRFSLLHKAEIELIEEWIFWLSEYQSNPFRDEICMMALTQIEKCWK